MDDSLKQVANGWEFAPFIDDQWIAQNPDKPDADVVYRPGIGMIVLCRGKMYQVHDLYRRNRRGLVFTEVY